MQGIFDGLGHIEEGVVEEVEQGACAAARGLYHGEDVEVEWFDGQAAALLGEECAFSDFGHLIALAVEALLILFNLLACAEVFGPEALVAGQFVDAHLAEGHLGVDLVGDDDLLALVGVGVGNGGAGEELGAVDLRGRLRLLRPGVEGLAALLLLLALLLLGLAHFLHLDVETGGGYFLAVDDAGGCANGEGAFHIGQHAVGEGGLMGTADLSVVP